MVRFGYTGLCAALLCLPLVLAGCGVDLDAPVVQSSDAATFTPAPVAASASPTAKQPLSAGASPTNTIENPGALGATKIQNESAFSVDVTIDINKHHQISPLIYGLNNSGPSDEELMRWLGVTLVRWGGNARTRHNWEINASNVGSDWEFRNVSQGNTTPGSASLLFMQRNERLGAATLLTIPTIGWVAKNGDENTQSVSVPEHGGPAVSEGSDVAFSEFVNEQWQKPYDPAANRERTSVQSLPAKGAPFSYPPDLTDGKVYQDEWVAYLKSVRPAGSAPMIYSMDNEPDLWADNSHVDVHPVRMSYDDMLSNFLTYAKAVKAVDHEGLVAGPESWGVTGYLFSALDDGGDKYFTAADRKAHGGLPFLVWFLRALKEQDREHGSRTLDVLSIHYYPSAGQYSDNVEPQMREKRVQGPRALWDGRYIEPSWVGRTEWANLALLRRLNNLIEEHYPGTRLGLSEWNFGGIDDISGGIATADALGIFGREKLYYAAYWGKPSQTSPTGWAFRLYRNYDGEGSSFGTESVQTVSNMEDNYLSAYGALDAGGSKLTLVLVNKDPERTAEVAVKPGAFRPKSSAKQYSYGQADLSGITEQSLPVDNAESVIVSVPPYTFSMVVLEREQ